MHDGVSSHRTACDAAERRWRNSGSKIQGVWDRESAGRGCDYFPFHVQNNICTRVYAVAENAADLVKETVVDWAMVL
jgi:hypothetical protein